MEKLLTLKEVAERLRVGRTTVWKLRRSGALPTVRIGRKVLVDARDLEAFIQERKSRRVKT